MLAQGTLINVLHAYEFKLRNDLHSLHQYVDCRLLDIEDAEEEGYKDCRTVYILNFQVQKTTSEEISKATQD